MPQTLQQFGATIKAKYPQYNDISDQDLGSKMLTKYPQYNDMVDQNDAMKYGQQKSSQGMSDTLRSVGLGFLPDTLADITDIGTATKGALTGTNGFANGYNNPFRSEANLTKTRNQQDLSGFSQNVAGNTASIASMAIPGLDVVPGAGIANTAINKAITGGVRGALYEGGRELSNDQGINPGQVGAGAAGGAILEPLMAALNSGMLSKAGAYKNMAKAAENGADVDWNLIANKARDAAKNSAASTKNALEQLIAEETPATQMNVPEPAPGISPEVDQINPGNQSDGSVAFKRMGGVKPGQEGPPGYLKDVTPAPSTQSDYNGPLRSPTPYSGNSDIANMADGSTNISSPQLLQLRAALGKRLPSNFFEKLTSKVPQAEQEATDILRRTVSQHLKTAAPGIKTPDKLYSMYAKGQDVPTWARRILIADAAKHLLGNVPIVGSALKSLPLP